MVRLVAVVGPTATGKSDLALDIVQHIQKLGGAAEIVNCDSMQFYRGMDIGTAKLPVDQRRGVPHHLLDWLNITDESTAAEYQTVARETVTQLQNRGVTPVICGGSMLYAAAILNTFEFPARDEVLRASLELELIELGSNQMHRKLQSLDPTAASRIDPLNGRRVVRALEIVIVTGEPFAAALPEQPDSWQPVLQIGLNSERAHLVQRLHQRASKMWTAGLVSEVESLIPLGIRDGKTSSRAIGYAQALSQIDGHIVESEAIEQTALLTSRYARRQMSWFRRDSRINWLDYQDTEVTAKALQLVESQVALG